MKFHAPTGQFTVSQKDLESCCFYLKCALRSIRDTAGLPAGKYELTYPMTEADLAQAAIFDAAKAMGIHLGAERFNDLDVSV